MRAWLDRAPDHGGEKDARDLALAAYWYQHSTAVTDRLYDTDSGFELLEALGMDDGLAAVRLLALDAAEQLAPPNRRDLAERWARADLDPLVRDFLLPAGARQRVTSERRRALVDQFTLPAEADAPHSG